MINRRDSREWGGAVGFVSCPALYPEITQPQGLRNVVCKNGFGISSRRHLFLAPFGHCDFVAISQTTIVCAFSRAPESTPSALRKRSGPLPPARASTPLQSGSAPKAALRKAARR